MLGGDVVLAHTQVGFGSTFKVTIQTERSEFTTDQAHAQTESATLIQQPINKELSGLRILIAEDTPDQALLIKLLLTNLGAQVETAENGQDAVNMALHNDYTIVLMDMQMPILDGYQATATLRDKGFRRPVLALTAQAMKTDIRKCLDSGCSGHLSKPFSRETLVTAIRECLHANKA
jgi:CheY-like chemotaxis protein